MGTVIGRPLLWFHLKRKKTNRDKEESRTNNFDIYRSFLNENEKFISFNLDVALKI